MRLVVNTSRGSIYRCQPTPKAGGWLSATYELPQDHQPPGHSPQLGIPETHRSANLFIAWFALSVPSFFPAEQGDRAEWGVLEGPGDVKSALASVYYLYSALSPLQHERMRCLSLLALYAGI